MEISAYIVSRIFIEGYTSIIGAMNKLNIIIDTYSKVFDENTDEARVARQSRMNISETKAARTGRNQQQTEDNQLF